MSEAFCNEIISYELQRQRRLLEMRREGRSPDDDDDDDDDVQPYYGEWKTRDHHENK